jgi:ATP-dependent protease Clp ATPase subunit
MAAVEFAVPTVAELIARTDEVVAGLDDVKRRLASVLHRHIVSGAHGRPLGPSNVLVIGPPGGGKTFTCRTMLEAAGVPFVEESLTSFSDVGYVGRDLTSMLASFWGPRWHTPKQDRLEDTIERAERFGVVLLDEFDKARKEPGAAGAQGRVVGPALQAELLKLVEGGDFFAQPHERAPGHVINTTRILWIAVGAFDGIHRLVEPDWDDRTAYVRADAVHVMEYGFRPELVRRLANMVILPPLDVVHMLRILREHIWPRWVQQAADDGFELIDEGGLQHVASKAMHARMGASALDAILEECMWRPWSRAEPGDLIVLSHEGVMREDAELVRRPAA